MRVASQCNNDDFSVEIGIGHQLTPSASAAELLRQEL
jgi:hypothetical protein